MGKDKIQYDQIFKHSIEGLLVSNERGIIEMVNPRLLKMFGYDFETELLGQAIEILVPNRHKKRHVGLQDGYYDKPAPRAMGGDSKLTAQRKDGSEFPVEISLSYYQEGDKNMIIAFIVDISKRVAVEQELYILNAKLENEVEERTQELNTQNKLLLSISKNFPNGNIYVLQSDYTIVWADGQLLRDRGLNDKTLINHSFIDRLPIKVKDQIKEDLAAAFRGKTMDAEIQNDDRFYSFYAVPLKMDEEGVETVLLVEMDITDTKEMELEMLKSLEKEKELNEMKSRFVSMASHEFRTPLSSIVSSATLIGKYTEGHQQSKRDKHISRIKRSVTNLTAILNDFLSIDRLEEGKTALTFIEVNLKNLAEEVMEEVSVINKEGQSIDYQHEGETHIILSDEKLLKNIFLNLLSNAGKYSPDYAVTILRTKVKSDTFELSVKDNGIGIPKEEQHQLFSRFFRAKNVTNIQGTGLGLNIVKKYVELLGGSIDFESDTGKGTTFNIVIPLNK